MNDLKRRWSLKSSLSSEDKEDLEGSNNFYYKKRSSFRIKRAERKDNICFVKDSFENYGNFHISVQKEKIRMWNVKQINFPINRKIFDLGKKQDVPEGIVVPNLKFWINRYYYFHKFDEGIKMDYESY